MSKEYQFLKGSIFDKPFMQTRIHTHSMTLAEKLLGFLVGPAGILVFLGVINDLKELYYTSVVPVDKLFGSGSYLLMTSVTSVVGILVGLLMAWIVDHTVCKAGKIRPYILIGSIILVISGLTIFNCPFERGSTAHLVWIWAGNICFVGIGCVIFNLRYNKLALATRSLRDRSAITTLYKMADTLITGVLAGFLISSILYYRFLANDMTGKNWAMMSNIAACIAVPLMFVEYFFSRERVTEEVMETNLGNDGIVKSVPLGKQLKALLTNKYYLLVLLITVADTMCLNLQGINIRTNYCQWVLGANAENNLQVLYQALAMAPMGFGIALIYPVMRKIGAKKTVMVSAIICAVAGIVCCLFPTNMAVAFGGSFVFNFGTLGITYIGAVFGQQANDIIEYEHGFRPEGGVAAAVIVAVYGALVSPMNGLYETVLLNLGYDAFSTVGQNDAVIRWIVFIWFGTVAIKGIVWFVGLFFFDADKKIVKIQAELKERRKAAVLSRGEEWIDEEERELREKEESERRFEMNRIADLKAKCAKRGLDFETENRKYLEKKAKKDARKARKLAKAAED